MLEYLCKWLTAGTHVLTSPCACSTCVRPVGCVATAEWTTVTVCRVINQHGCQCWRHGPHWGLVEPEPLCNTQKIYTLSHITYIICFLVFGLLIILAAGVQV